MLELAKSKYNIETTERIDVESNASPDRTRSEYKPQHATYPFPPVASSTLQILSSVCYVSALAKSTTPHTDAYNNEVNNGTPITGKVTMVFLSNHPNATFVHGRDELPVEQGSLVVFDGDLPHHTIIPDGENVYMLGPLTLHGPDSLSLAVIFSACCAEGTCPLTGFVREHRTRGDFATTPEDNALFEALCSCDSCPCGTDGDTTSCTPLAFLWAAACEECPSAEPSGFPSSPPSNEPSSNPSAGPSNISSSNPSQFPSSPPSSDPSAGSTSVPSSGPSSVPSNNPSHFPSIEPSSDPSADASAGPSSVPSGDPLKAQQVLRPFPRHKRGHRQKSAFVCSVLLCDTTKTLTFFQLRLLAVNCNELLRQVEWDR